MSKKVEIDETVLKVQSEMDGIVCGLLQLEQDKAQLEALLDSRIEQLKHSFDIKKTAIDFRIEHLQNELRVLFEQVPQKATKTQRKVTLLAGDVVVKNATKKLECDKKLLLENSYAYDLGAYVTKKTVEDFDWAGLKAKLEILDDGTIVNNETGEVINVDGLKVVDEPEKLIIK